MNKKIFSLSTVIAAALASSPALAAGSLAGAAKVWTFTHSAANNGVTGFLSEITAFDSTNNHIWVAGVKGVDILNAANGSFVKHISVADVGAINSVTIHNGVAAFAIESSNRVSPGLVRLYDTTSRAQLGADITVGALPDMLTFTKDGSKLLVANEASPNTYGTPTTAAGVYPRNFGPAAVDPAGSVSIIDVATRAVTTATLAGVPASGLNIRSNTGMDFEPEYIAVNAAGTKAYVSLQEANAMGVLNLQTGSFESVIGLGAKSFNVAKNYIDPTSNNVATQATLVSVNAKGLYMPDGMVAYQARGDGKTYVVMANEGDFREDDGDRSNGAANTALGATGTLSGTRLSTTDSKPGDLYLAGARSFSIRGEDGGLVYDSGNILDSEAIKAGIYDDTRSVHKGVEPEGVELMTIGGRDFAFIGLERTTKGAVAVFDITDPVNSSFVQMLVTEGDVAPEGLKGYVSGGYYYLAISNETSNTTSVYQLAPVPEPETYAMMLAGLGLVALGARRRQSKKA